ncbi:MAG: ABC transporter substrate-binding protein [Pseudomonadota bacterium]
MINSPISRRRFLNTSVTAAAATALGPSMTFAADGDTLTIRAPGDISNIDPGFWQNTADLWVMDAIFPRLINFKPGSDWEWELYSAESIVPRDATTIDFTLKPGSMWSGGYGEVTAEDVKYSFERYLDADLEAQTADNWSLLDRVDVTGTHTGTIKLKEPFAPIWWFVLPYATGSIVCKAAVEELADKKFSLEPPAMGGAYHIKEHVAGQRIVLEANEDFAGPKAHFKTVEILPITDSKAAENAIQAGQLDFTRISLSVVPEFQANMPEGLEMDLKFAPDNVWMGMNAASPRLADIRVRQAILKAIDVDAILEGAYFGVAERAHGPVSKGLLGYREDAPALRDVDGARTLIDEAGASGTTITLDTLSDTDFLTAAQIVQANLAEIGIDLQIESHEGGSFWSLVETKGKEGLDMQFQRWLAPPDLSWTTQWLLSTQAGVWNWQWFESSEFDDLHFAALGETDNTKRAEMLVQLQQMLDDSACYLWITQPPRPMVWKSDVVPAMKPNGDPRLELFKSA